MQSSKKPEDRTYLGNGNFTRKDNPVIVFRGKLDSLQSEILLVQLRIKHIGNNILFDTLKRTLDFSREIMEAEVKMFPFASWSLLGMKSHEIREVSHNPKKYFGVNHIVPNLSMGEEILLINKLRTTTREVEISAVRAFSSTRIDLIEALNRLNSFFYICMLKLFCEQNE